MNLKCHWCGKDFKRAPRIVARGRSKCFCGLQCYWDYNRESSIEKFWKRVMKSGTDGCWPWFEPAKWGEPYPRIEFALLGFRRPIPVHRVAFTLTYGPLTKGKITCHSCNNTVCCNPKHLYAGTYKTNHDDSVKAGTATKPPLHIGEDQHSHKLTRGDVKSIRFIRKQEHATWRVIGARFGVSLQAARNAGIGKTWAWVK